MDHRVELLAPAGNMEGFYGAVHAGADAVYLGGERFGARAYADNFTAEELLTCIRYAHILGRRVYLTVNTLVKEKEFAELPLFLKPLYEGGLDGVIVQDIGVFAFIRDHFPGLKLHVSTQMTLTGSHGAALLKEMGADRIVPARELGLSEIKEMKKVAGLEIETFIHGAMCYCYSGQCLFSSILGGRSGNRGRCAQPCRLPYRVERDGGTLTGECYPLSLKDLCTIERIPELIEAGIDSFKIEGRMKKPEYTAGVTAIYRKYINRYYEEGAGVKVERRDLDDLASLYIRSGRQDGYYFRRNGREMVTLDSPSYSGCDEALLADLRERYLEGRPRMAISVRARFQVGQPAEVRFVLERQDREIQGIANGETVAAARSQPVTKENIGRQLGKLGDTLFQAERMEILADEQAFYPLKAINDLRREAAGQLADALLAENGFPARRGEPSEEAAGSPGSETFRNEMSGSEMSGNEMPGSEISGNEMSGNEMSGGGTPVSPGSAWHLSVRTGEQFAAAADFWGGRVERQGSGSAHDFNCGRICLDADLFEDALRQRDEAFFSACRRFRAAGCEMLIALPYILRGSDEGWLERLWEDYNRHRDIFSGFLARSMDGLGFLREHAYGEGKPPAAVYGDAGLYIWNRSALSALARRDGGFGLDGFCLPYELNAGEQRRLLEGEHIPCEKVVYGRIPLMVTANCVAKTIDACGGRPPEGAYVLRDRYGKRFPVLRVCGHCTNIIYNSVPLSLRGELSRWRERVGLRLDFTIESGEETMRVLRFFADGAGDTPSCEYTTGHEKRGVE